MNDGHIDREDPRLTAYALGELDPDEAQEVARAVAADPRLAAEVQAIRAVGAALAAELADEPAPTLGAQARAAVLQGGAVGSADAGATRAERRAWRRWAAGGVLAAAAAAAVVVYVGQDAATPGSAPEPPARPAEQTVAAAGEARPATGTGDRSGAAGQPEPPARPAEQTVAAAGEARPASGTGDRSSATGQPEAQAASAPVAAPKATEPVVEKEAGGREQAQAQVAHRSHDGHPASGAAEGPRTAADPSRSDRDLDSGAQAALAGNATIGTETEAAPVPDAVVSAPDPGGGDASGAWASGNTGGGAPVARVDGGSSRASGPLETAALAAGSGARAQGAAPTFGTDATEAASPVPSAGDVTTSSPTATGAKLLAAKGADHAAVGRSGLLGVLGGGGLRGHGAPAGLVTLVAPNGSLVTRFVGEATEYPVYYDPYTYATYRYWPAPPSSEGYAPIFENAFERVADAPLSTFSADVDTASYANVRRFLQRRQAVPTNAVRIEELVNAFTYETPMADDGQAVAVATEVAGCPWAPPHRLVRVALAARDVPPSQRPPGNLVFLVDTSGSMQASNKLPLLVKALRGLVEQLDERDTVSIVTYAGRAGVALPPTNGSDKAKILRAIGRLRASGRTNGSAGLQLAYQLARERFVQGGTNRVLLATDGDFNAGMTGRGELVNLVANGASRNIYLTVLGLGTGDLKDDRLEAISGRGNGTYAYLDSLREARRVLVDQLTATLVTVAKDVKIQVEWNPARVAAYRLIGYEDRTMAARDFDNDRKDAGDMGAGARVTALYEVVTTGVPPVPVRRNLKYQPAPTAEPQADDASTELMTVKVRYKSPQGDGSETVEATLIDEATSFEEASTDLQWAAAVASFGMLLRGSYYRGMATWSQARALAVAASGDDPNGERTELIELIDRAHGLYGGP